jgi:phosphoglycolate phosphatase
LLNLKIEGGSKLIKAVALDVDGTITDGKRRLCTSSIKAIHKTEKMGIPVIIVTGNIMCSTNMISILLGTSGGFVAENGGIIESCRGKKILGNIEKCQKAYEILKSKLDVEKVDYSDQRFSEIALTRDIPSDLVKESLKNVDVEVYDSKFAIHLTDPVVDKGSSLKIVAGDMGIKTSEILAIGDGENDIEFLKVAGVKVAVANADEELKSIADYVTEKSYGDGVEEAIERFLV